MGRRINKVLGYGLIDFKGFGKDERLNPEFDYDKFIDSFYDADHVLKFKQYFDKKVEDELKILGKENKGKIKGYFEWASCIKNIDENHKIKNNAFIYNDDYGEKNVLLFTNPFKEDLQRHDDIIDYHECGTDHNGSQNYFKVIEGGIYPYISTYIDVNSGEILRNANEILLIKNYHKNKGEKTEEYVSKLNEFCKITFNITYFDFLRNYNTTIDPIVYRYVQFINIFKNETEIRKLVPMIYVYWS